MKSTPLSPVNASSNVNIKIINGSGKVVRDTSIHNKATINLVEGILRFLRSEFTPSYYNSSVVSYYPSDARSYIPSEVRFGHVGVIMKDRDTDKPRLVSIDEGQIKKPGFEEYRLQEEIAADRLRFAMTKIRFETAELVSFSDTNNSMALRLHAYVPPGQLVCLNDSVDPIRGYLSQSKFYSDENHTKEIVPSNTKLYYDIPHSTYYKWVPDTTDAGGSYVEATEVDIKQLSKFYFIDENIKSSEDDRDGQGWVYYRGDENDPGYEGRGYEAIFTEIGLYSAEGVLLARVAFDGTLSVGDYGEVIFDDPANENNPVIQSEDSSIVIDWTIGITSVGPNDEIITGADLRNLGLSMNASSEDISKIINGREVGGYVVGLLHQLQILVDRYKELTGDDFKVTNNDYKSLLAGLISDN